jgi:hypothetical protein
MQFVIKPMGAMVLVAGIGILLFLILTPRPNVKSTNPTPVPGTPLQRPDTIVLSLATEQQTGKATTGYWRYNSEEAGSGSLQIVPVTGGTAGETEALQIVTQKTSAKEIWFVQSYFVLPYRFEPKERITLRFLARSPQANTATVVFEESGAPFFRDFGKEIQLTPEWKEYTFTFPLSRRYEPLESKVGLQVGRQKGTYEFTGLKLSVETGATPTKLTPTNP